jgi:hypothetical protein
VYITFAEYQSMGGTVTSESTFSMLEYKAEKLVDYYTAGRVSKMSAVPEAVQRLMVELINIDNVANAQVLVESPAVSSFSNDGFSESYAEPVTTDSLHKIRTGLFTQYLSNVWYDDVTLLLSRGLY